MCCCRTAPRVRRWRVCPCAHAAAQLHTAVRAMCVYYCRAYRTQALAEVPMRLLKIEAVLGWKELRVYEECKVGQIPML